MTREKRLTPKQRAFVAEYMTDLNGAQAAIRAGYSSSTAKQMATKLFANPRVAEAIAIEMKKRGERTSITADRVLLELARVAFLDVRRVFNSDGSMKRLDELDSDVAAAIAGIEISEIRDADGAPIGVVKRIRLADKIAALTLAARHLGLLNDKLKLQGDPENPLTALIKHIQGNTFRAVPYPIAVRDQEQRPAAVAGNSIGIARGAHANDDD